jgi:hypothetical protein
VSELSLAAQATYDAFNRIGLYNEPSFETDSKALASALRAAVKHCTCNDGKDYWIYGPNILAIADELEGVKYGTYRCDLKTQ